MHHDEGGLGRFAYEPRRSEDAFGDEPVTHVELRHDEDETSGPFWTDEGFLGADYEDVHASIGISRSLFDDAVSWARTGGTYERKAELLRRLRAEVADSIEVERPVALD